MKIFGHPMSTCTRKVLCTLAEKGAEADFSVVELMRGDHKKPEHLARQPFGVIPVLIEDDGYELYESRAILHYLDAKLPGVALTPSSLKDKGKMEQWISVEYSYFSKHAMTIVMEVMMKPMRGGQTDQAAVDKAREALKTPLDVLERHLSSNQFLAGGIFSLADICYLPYLEYLSATPHADLIAAHPSVAAWWERCRQRPSWKKAIGQG